jgi:hypothetical protein
MPVVTEFFPTREAENSWHITSDDRNWGSHGPCIQSKWIECFRHQWLKRIRNRGILCLLAGK